jgi:hypothetical protein
MLRLLPLYGSICNLWNCHGIFSIMSVLRLLCKNTCFVQKIQDYWKSILRDIVDGFALKNLRIYKVLTKDYQYNLIINIFCIMRYHLYSISDILNFYSLNMFQLNFLFPSMPISVDIYLSLYDHLSWAQQINY